MSNIISVILPSYNPNLSRLNQTLAGLKNQTLAFANWELIIIDNNSVPAISIDVNWHPNHKIISELNQGLTNARLKGLKIAAGNIIVMVDDDNILDKDYLKNVLAIFQLNSKLGAIGGKSIPAFETAPPTWLKEFYANLALRDLGETELVTGWKNEYPACAPIGAGMAVRKEALCAYITNLNAETSIITDRTGNSLSSGGDNDIILEILKSGWLVGYYPSLVLNHIIPQQRTTIAYLSRLLNHTNKSWIQVLEKHHINPWHKIAKWTLPLRKAKAWLTYKVWQNKINYIKWQGACGLFDGMATIEKNRKA